MADAELPVPNPKVFISYSWTTDDHKRWVLELAKELRQNGVDVRIDQIHLVEGQESAAFMEEMVNDPNITGVLLICDRRYVEKANGRTGGAGTEAQIITREIYNSQRQTKFVAVCTEMDDAGEPVRPTYYGTRIYIDFTDAAKAAEAMTKMLHWAFGQPIEQLPPLGKPPAFLTRGSQTVQLGTSLSCRRAIDAIRSGKPNAMANLREYFDVFVSELEKFRMTPGVNDEKVRENVAGFIPYRNEMIDVFIALGLQGDNGEMRDVLHRLFEAMIPYTDKPPHVMQWNTLDFDNFKFIINEIFLYCIGTMLKYECYKNIAGLLEDQYFVGDVDRNGQNPLRPYTIFRQHLPSIGLRDHDGSVHATLLKDRSTAVALDYRYVTEADILLYVRGAITLRNTFGWYPVTSSLLPFVGRPLEVFARARSKRFFEKIKPILGVKDVAELRQVTAAIDANANRQPRWGFDTMSLANITDAENLCTVP